MIYNVINVSGFDGSDFYITYTFNFYIEPVTLFSLPLYTYDRTSKKADSGLYVPSYDTFADEADAVIVDANLESCIPNSIHADILGETIVNNRLSSLSSITISVATLGAYVSSDASSSIKAPVALFYDYNYSIYTVKHNYEYGYIEEVYYTYYFVLAQYVDGRIFKCPESWAIQFSYPILYNSSCSNIKATYTITSLPPTVDLIVEPILDNTSCTYIRTYKIYSISGLHHIRYMRKYDPITESYYPSKSTPSNSPINVNVTEYDSTNNYPVFSLYYEVLDHDLTDEDFIIRSDIHFDALLDECKKHNLKIETTCCITVCCYPDLYRLVP